MLVFRSDSCFYLSQKKRCISMVDIKKLFCLIFGELKVSEVWDSEIWWFRSIVWTISLNFDQKYSCWLVLFCLWLVPYTKALSCCEKHWFVMKSHIWQPKSNRLQSGNYCFWGFYFSQTTSIWLSVFFVSVQIIEHSFLLFCETRKYSSKKSIIDNSAKNNNELLLGNQQNETVVVCAEATVISKEQANIFQKR